MAKNSKGLDFLHQGKPWDSNNNNIWLASTINLSRNIEKIPFPPKLNKERRLQIISLVSKTLLHSASLKNPYLIKIEDIGPNEKEFFVEHFLSPQSFQQAHSGEAFIIDDTGEFLAILNLNNHIQFELLDCRGELETAWNLMVKIETELGKSINFSFSPKFGFLTADPATSGTGFILTVYLQPSALIHSNKFEETLERIKYPGVTIAGIQGDRKHLIGDVVTIRNSYTLGVTEENIISSLRLFTTKLLVEESSARSHLRQEENREVKDKVSRAFGVLVHSYQIETIEALNSISLLKLGADLGWLKGVTAAELNKLFFNCRRAHLLTNFGEEVSQSELSHKRAEFIHQTLKHCSLAI